MSWGDWYALLRSRWGRKAESEWAEWQSGVPPEGRLVMSLRIDVDLTRFDGAPEEAFHAWGHAMGEVVREASARRRAVMETQELERMVRGGG